MATTTQAVRPTMGASYFRWTICGLLFLASTINYVDRQVIGLLKPTLQAQFGWGEIDYADIIFPFQPAYAVGFVFAGRFIDKVGTRLGFSIALLVWSAAAIAHAFAPAFGASMVPVLGLVGLSYSASVAGFMTARFALGIGESGNFPAAIKTVAEWFPKKERALATGIFNSGANIGAVVAPILVPWILGAYGWQEAFIITGGLAFIWLIFWFIYYEVPAKEKRLNAAELAYINSDADEQPITDDATAKPISYAKLLGLRQTWAFLLGKFLTDPVWYF